MSFKSLMEGTRLGELFEAPKELLAADHDLPIAAALAAMAQRRVLSLPVVIRSGRAEPHATRALVSTGGLPVTSLLGFVGVADVLSALIAGAHAPAARRRRPLARPLAQTPFRAPPSSHSPPPLRSWPYSRCPPLPPTDAAHRPTDAPRGHLNPPLP